MSTEAGPETVGWVPAVLTSVSVEVLDSVLDLSLLRRDGAGRAAALDCPPRDFPRGMFGKMTYYVAEEEKPVSRIACGR